MEDIQKNEASPAKAGKSNKIVVMIICIGVLFLVSSYILKPSAKEEIVEAPAVFASVIRVADDGKTVVDNNSGEVIFSIEEAKKYLKDNGYEYNADTFQSSNAKYAGECFSQAVLSYDKREIIFSTSCLPGDLPEAWIGVYEISAATCSLGNIQTDPAPAVAGDCGDSGAQTNFRFVAGGGGENFVWSADDKTVAYSAYLGLTGNTEERVIDIETGKVRVAE